LIVNLASFAGNLNGIELSSVESVGEYGQCWRLRLLRGSSTENISADTADTGLFYGQFFGVRVLLWEYFLGINVYRIAYIEGAGST
jgi:hypothetical protein